MSAQPLLNKDPDSTYGALTPPPRMADMRREHKASIDTSVGTVFFFTTPLASCLACLFLPCALLGAPTTIPPRHEVRKAVLSKSPALPQALFLPLTVRVARFSAGGWLSAGTDRSTGGGHSVRRVRRRVAAARHVLHQPLRPAPAFRQCE